MASLASYPFPLVTCPATRARPGGKRVTAGHLGDRRTGDGFHDCVIAQLHDAQLHEHGPPTLRRELRHDGACPSGRCQASGEAAVSTISRSRAQQLYSCLPDFRCESGRHGSADAVPEAVTVHAPTAMTGVGGHRRDDGHRCSHCRRNPSGRAAQPSLRLLAGCGESARQPIAGTGRAVPVGEAGQTRDVIAVARQL
jgi:hypothetical protein